MTITVKDLIAHLEGLDPDLPVMKRHYSNGERVDPFDAEDFKSTFFCTYALPYKGHGQGPDRQCRMDMMSNMNKKIGQEIEDSSAFEILAI